MSGPSERAFASRAVVRALTDQIAEARAESAVLRHRLEEVERRLAALEPPPPGRTD